MLVDEVEEVKYREHQVLQVPLVPQPNVDRRKESRRTKKTLVLIIILTSILKLLLHFTPSLPTPLYTVMIRLNYMYDKLT